MAFRGRYGEASVPSTYNTRDITDSFYEPNVLDNQWRHPVWAGSSTGLAPSDPYILPGGAGQQYTELSRTAKRHCSGNTPWSPTWLPTPYNTAWGMPVEASVYASPELSSQSTSRRSSKSIGLIPTPTLSNCTSLRETFPSDEHFMFLDNRVEIEQTPGPVFAIDQSFLEHDISPHSHPSNLVEAPTLTDFRLDKIQEQTWQESDYGLSQPGSQHVASSSRCQPPAYRATGIWQMNADRTWTPCDKAPTQHDNAANVSWDEPDEADSIAPRRKAGSNPKKEYPPVQCKQCGKVYSGQYGAGNMRRHASIKHANGVPTKYMCSFCYKSFNRSDALLGHERKKHASLTRDSER